VIGETIVIPKQEEERKNWRWDSHGRRLPDAPEGSVWKYDVDAVIDWDVAEGRKAEFDSIVREKDESDLDSAIDWMLPGLGAILLFSLIILIARLL